MTGSAATKAAVLRGIERAAYVHLATHGVLHYASEESVPGAVVLARSGSDDGLLTSSEIAKLRLSATLIVLSACSTATGRISSDGVIGLSRAFLAAGAQSVLASLWNVPDQPTRELMTGFYTALLKVHDKAQALRLAMLELSKKHPNPIDWAGFILIGDNQ